MTDVNALMQRNLREVFSERDPVRRLATIQEVYAADALLFEPDAVVSGHAAICDAVTALLGSLPSDIAFVAVRPADGHHGVGRLHWTAGTPNSPAMVRGADFAHIESDRIKTLHVFLDPTAT